MALPLIRIDGMTLRFLVILVWTADKYFLLEDKSRWRSSLPYISTVVIAVPRSLNAIFGQDIV